MAPALRARSTCACRVIPSVRALALGDRLYGEDGGAGLRLLCVVFVWVLRPQRW